LVQSYVFDERSGDLGQPRAGIDDHSNERPIPPALEVRAVASLQQGAELVVAENRRR
jgi:hypothetical protein